MATTHDPDADGPTGRIQRTLDTVSDIVDETENGALVTVAVACLALVGAFVGFLLISPYTPAFLLVFVAATGYGWLRHQEVTAKVVTLVMTVVTILILGLITVFIFLEAREVARFTSGEVFGITVPALTPTALRTTVLPVTSERVVARSIPRSLSTTTFLDRYDVSPMATIPTVLLLARLPTRRLSVGRVMRMIPVRACLSVLFRSSRPDVYISWMP